MQVGIRLGFFNGMAAIGQKGIISRVDQKRRDGNVFQEWFAAALAPIILRVGEAVNGCSVTIIKVLKGAELPVTIVVDFPWHPFHFRPDFLAKTDEKAPHVNLIGRLAQLNGAGLKIARNGNSRGLFYSWIEFAAEFSEIFQSQVAAQTESNQRQFYLVTHREDMGEHRLQIDGGAAVSKMENSIWFTTAASGIPHHGIPSVLQERPDHALGVCAF